jgi:hypothetical protein
VGASLVASVPEQPFHLGWVESHAGARPRAEPDCSKGLGMVVDEGAADTESSCDGACIDQLATCHGRLQQLGDPRCNSLDL